MRRKRKDPLRVSTEMLYQRRFELLGLTGSSDRLF
jgi:hypothetical protein